MHRSGVEVVRAEAAGVGMLGRARKCARKLSDTYLVPLQLCEIRITHPFSR